MTKLLYKLCFICSLLFVTTTQATLITTELAEDAYITYQGIDFAWASMVNSEKFYVGVDSHNELLKPTDHEGWDYATDEQLGLLTALSGADLLALFTREDGSYIHAFEYWNTVYDQVNDTANILAGEIRSQWSWTAPEGEIYDDLTSLEKTLQFLEIANTPLTDFETIYVRASQGEDNNPVQPIPEPSTLLIFSLAIIALASRKKLFN